MANNTNNPLIQIKNWLKEEQKLGNIFPRGAVLSTISKDGYPRSRVVGTLFDEQNILKFFTSPNSRKIEDINFCKHISLTFSFHNSIRSISIEGIIKSIEEKELNEDWLKHDDEFRKHYVIFGDKSGDKIDSLDEFKHIKNTKDINYNIRPKSFIGYKFDIIKRISFYSVKENDFAINDVYERDEKSKEWEYSLLVP